MKSIHLCVYALLLSNAGLLQAQVYRWGFLGDDDGLKATFEDAKQVVLVCVFETELRDVAPPFAEIVYHATVIESQKGGLEVGEKIQIRFRTDSLPVDEDERRKFVEKENTKAKGALKFAFLDAGDFDGGKDGVHFCDAMDVTTYSKAMQDFLRQLQGGSVKPNAEQGGAAQPAPAPEPKAEGNEGSKPKSEGRPK